MNELTMKEGRREEGRAEIKKGVREGGEECAEYDCMDKCINEQVYECIDVLLNG